MSVTERKLWLVGYDIRCPTRLRRVHALLRKRALALQYSLHALEASETGIRALMGELRERIDSRVDDLRAWQVPVSAPVWTAGRSLLPEGMGIEGTALDPLLRADRKRCAAA